MKAIKIIKHIERQGIENREHQTFRYAGENACEFVRRYFGGDFVAGGLAEETDYIAFWDGFQPEGCPDAVVTDDQNGKIYIYEIE